MASIHIPNSSGPNAERQTPNASSVPWVAIFIHGAGGGGWEWNVWEPVFTKAGWVCVKEDLVPAKAGIADTHFADYIAQVEAWAKSHQPCKLTLIGASMGGILAQKATETLKPDALVLVNSVGPAGIGTRKAKQWPKVIEWSKGTLKETQDSMPDSDDATIQFAFHHWRDESGAVLREISRGVPVASPRCPVLVVLGDQDTDVPNATGKEMAHRYGADMKIYKGMSHVGPLLGKRAPEVAKFVAKWLDKHVR